MVFSRIKNMFRANKGGTDVTINHTVRDLKKGWILDYDLRSWEVKGTAIYKWENGSTDHECTLNDGKTTRYLSFSVGDSLKLSIFDDANLDAINGQLRSRALSGNPLQEFVYRQRQYRLVDGGRAFVKSDAEEYEMENWLYADTDHQQLVSVNSYGDHSAEAFTGQYIKEIDVSNILPR